MTPERWETNEVGSMIKGFQGKGIQEKPGIFFFFEVRRWNWKCGKAKEAGVHKSEYQGQKIWRQMERN